MSKEIDNFFRDIQNNIIDNFNSLEGSKKDVYDDVDPRLHRIAKASLEAHLIKLQADGKVGAKANIWEVIN